MLRPEHLINSLVNRIYCKYFKCLFCIAYYNNEELLKNCYVKYTVGKKLKMLKADSNDSIHWIISIAQLIRKFHRCLDNLWDKS